MPTARTARSSGPTLAARPTCPRSSPASPTRDVDFLVLGSGAAALLGADLVPGDLDICPASDADNLRRLAGVLEAIGARPRVDVPGWVTDEEAAAWRPVAEIGVLDFLFETNLGDLDIVFEALGPDGRGSLDHRALAEDAITVDVDGRPVARRLARACSWPRSSAPAGRRISAPGRSSSASPPGTAGMAGLRYGDAVPSRAGAASPPDPGPRRGDRPCRDRSRGCASLGGLPATVAARLAPAAANATFSMDLVAAR